MSLQQRAAKLYATWNEYDFYNLAHFKILSESVIKENAFQPRRLGIFPRKLHQKGKMGKRSRIIASGAIDIGSNPIGAINNIRPRILLPSPSETSLK